MYGGFLEIDQTVIKLNSCYRMRLLFESFLDSEDFSLSKEEIYNQVYASNREWCHLSERYRQCISQSITKLVSRSRYKIANHLSHEGIEWLFFDRFKCKWVLYRQSSLSE